MGGKAHETHLSCLSGPRGRSPDWPLKNKRKPTSTIHQCWTRIETECRYLWHPWRAASRRGNDGDWKELRFVYQVPTSWTDLRQLLLSASVENKPFFSSSGRVRYKQQRWGALSPPLDGGWQGLTWPPPIDRPHEGKAPYTIGHVDAMG